MLNKLVNDTLKSPNGKWSIKRIVVFINIHIAWLLGAWIVVYGLNNNRHAIDVFEGLLFFQAALMGITEFGKKINKDATNEKLQE